jgi:hypothetical protein
LFGCNVHGSCFITPPSAQGFTSHYDTYSFFALQLFGTKKWNLYGRTMLPPIREDRDVDEPGPSGPPTQQLMLKAGDFLYVPRGLYHDAETSQDPSIHLTLGFFAPNWIDVIRSALAELHSDEALRRAAFGKNDHDFLAEASSIKDLLMRRLDLRKGLELLQREYFDRRVDVRTDRLLDGLSAECISAETTLRLQSGLPYTLTRSENRERAELQFASKKLSYPAVIEGVLRLMIDSQPFTVHSLPTTMSESSLLLLCQQLLREGFLGKLLKAPAFAIYLIGGLWGLFVTLNIVHDFGGTLLTIAALGIGRDGRLPSGDRKDPIPRPGHVCVGNYWSTYWSGLQGHLKREQFRRKPTMRLACASRASTRCNAFYYRINLAC